MTAKSHFINFYRQIRKQINHVGTPIASLMKLTLHFSTQEHIQPKYAGTPSGKKLLTLHKIDLQYGTTLQ